MRFHLKRSSGNTGTTVRWFVQAAIAASIILTRTAGAQNAVEAPANNTSEPSTDVLQEVVVTGTLIRGAQPTGSELVTLDRTAIEKTAALTTTNLMTNLPQLASFNSLPLGTVDFANPVPRFNIRNAIGGTLVLLNGHRMVGQGTLQTTPDPSAIPVSMIERVEVLPDGASATYGADAIAGVVNFILRDNFDGAETRLSYGTALQYTEYDLSQLVGKSWGSGSVMANFEYTSHSNFSFGSRPYYLANVTAFGGKDHTLTTCQPPNVTANGKSYAGPTYALGTNHCDPNSYSDLVPYQHRATWFLAGHQELTDNLTLRGDAFFSANDVTDNAATTSSTFTINNTNPYFLAPPGTGATSETVRYWWRNEFGSTRRNELTWNALGAYLSLTYKFGSDWQAKLSGNYGHSTNFARTPAVDGTVLTNAVTATTPTAAFDPFTGKTNPSVIAAIGGGGVAYTSDQGLREGELDVDGPLFQLPGGEVRLAVGATYRTENLNGVPYILSNGALVGGLLNGPQSPSRSDKAEFLELHIPIVGNGNGVTGIEKLDLSAAGRHDQYSDFGGTTNPKFALDYMPIRGLTFRGSASSSFQAPALSDMRSVDTRLQTQAQATFSPTGPQPGVSEMYIAGGTPTLQPQSAHTYTFGLEVAPPQTGFTAGATYWHTHISKQIALAFPNQVPLFTNPAFASFWWGPGGQPLTPAVLASLTSQFRIDQALNAYTPSFVQGLLTNGYIIDLRRKNLGTTTIDGIDFHVDYNWQSGWGDWAASVAGTDERQRLNIPGPGAPLTDLTKTDPDLQFRASLELNRPLWSAGANLNYVSPYNVTGTDVGTYQVATYMTTDVRVIFHIPEEAGLFGKLDLTVQANNVFDRNPPLLVNTNGYTIAHANPVGRLVSISLDKKW
jgi:iron complex outermembrane recepter protein